MKILVALDPSLTRSGLALYRDGKLVDTETITAPKKGDVAARCVNVGQRVLGMVGRFSYTDNEGLELVAEWPKVYSAGKSKGDPNDLLPLSAIIGAAGSALGLMYSGMAVTYLPRDWAGSTPKDETVAGAKSSPRAVRIKSRLEGSELAVWKRVRYHDEIDAIGIGLHHLGRLGRRRVFPRE